MYAGFIIISTGLMSGPSVVQAGIKSFPFPRQITAFKTSKTFFDALGNGRVCVSVQCVDVMRY